MKRKGYIAIGSSILALSLAGSCVLYANTTNKAENAAQPASSQILEGNTAEADLASYDLDEEYSGLGNNFIQLATTDLEVADEPGTAPFSYSNVADIAEAVMPSVVAITNTSVQQVRTWFSRRSYEYESVSAGTGIIVGENDTELLICTNNHVVEGANELTVTFIDDESYPATLKGADEKNDLAVVAVSLDAISDSTMSQLKIARIGDSDAMRIGEQVVAIGNALGYGQSVTTGIISAKDRTLQAGGSIYDTSSVTTYENLIQTDAAINLGNSGGALVNMNGEVIGINSAMASASSAENMGYAIPVSKAMPILEDLMTRKTRVKLADGEYGYMGITGQSVSYDATRLYGIPAGIYVVEIGEDSPAQQCGLKVSDIITSFDGEAVTSMDDLLYRLQYYAPGEEIEVEVYTNNDGVYEEETLTITLGDRNAV